MEKITDWTEVGLQSLMTLSNSVMRALPNIMGALFLLILGWIIAKILSFVVRKTLKLVGFDKLAEKVNVNEILGKANIGAASSHIVGTFVYWVIMLLFFVTASDTLGWTVVSESISDLISYLPKLFSAVIIFVMGFYIASFVKKGMKGVLDSLSVTSSHLLSSTAFYIILVIISITALNQAGIDTAIITSNVILIIGGAIFAFAISFGFGSREILSNIISSFYTKTNFAIGQEIEIFDIKGTIQKIDTTSCVIKTKTGLTIIPVHKLLTEKVGIRD